MPFCGVRIATDFCRIVRDVTNHSETAFLFIGYNHLGKKGSTTGNLGKYLFIDATDVFSLSTQREITTVRLVTSYDLSRSPEDTQFRFTIGEDNLPHEAERDPKCKAIDDVTQDKLDSCNTTSNNDPNHQSISNKCKSVNNSLTIPTHPSTPKDDCSLSNDRSVHSNPIAVPSPSQRLFPSSRLSHKRRLCRRSRCPGSPCRGFATTPRKKARHGCCVAPDGNSLVFIVFIVFLFSSWRVWP